MNTLSQIPLLNITYRPEVPPDQAVGRVGDSLEELPTTLAAIGDNLKSSSAGWSRLRKD